jgi:hypothetical protein
MSGNEGGNEEIVVAALSEWNALHIRLTAIIGNGGFRALYARSLHLTSREYPWLATFDDATSKDAIFSSLAQSLRGQSPQIARDGHEALLRSFTAALTALIGAALTAQFIQSKPPQSGSEHPSQESDDDR